MSVRERLWDSLFWLMAGTLYAFALCDSILAATVFEVPRQTLLGLCTLFVAGFLVVFFNRYTGLIFLGGLVALAGVIGVSLLRGGFAAPWLERGTELFGELSLFIAGQIPYRAEYSQVFGLAICLLTGFLTALNMQVHFGFFILSVGALWVFAAPIYNEWDTSPPALALILLCFVLLLAKKLNLIAVSEDEYAPAGVYALLLIPLGAAIFALSWALPKPDVEAPGEFTAPDFSDAADRFWSELGPSTTGAFTPEGGRLGGPISLGDQHVMDVLANERLYLSGSIRDTYTGSSWTARDDSKTPLSPDGENAYDTADYPRELVDVQRYYMRYYGMSTDRAAIYPGDARTKAIFTPPFRLTLEPEAELSLTSTAYGSIEASRPLPRNSGYAQEYIAWNYQNSYIVGLLRGGAAASGPSGLSNGNRAAFLEVPDSLPQRVRDLAAELTADLADDYDKLKAIEAYLARFPYTLEPDPVPSGADFVDYFLFEGQEGYCVYYASALAVMGRCEGIPTRYVEGYVMPEEPNENGVYAVTGQQAHAWVEAYFDGFGWVPFEATRPYAVIQGEPLPSMEEDSPHETEPETDAPVTEPESATEPEESTELDIPVPTEADNTTEQPKSPGLRRLLPVLLTAAVAAGVLAVRGLRLRFRRRLEKLGALPPRESAGAWFAMLVNAAGAYGLPMKREETALSYAQRAGDRLWFREHTFPELAEIYSRAAYSQDEITGEECAAIRDCYRELIKKLPERRKNPLRYLLDRYVWLRY